MSEVGLAWTLDLELTEGLFDQPLVVLAADRALEDLGGDRDRQIHGFVTDLLERQFPGAMVSPLGGQGDDQRGYDILIVHADGKRMGVQCKRERQFGPKKVADAIKAGELEMDESVIALARPATAEPGRLLRSPAMRQAPPPAPSLPAARQPAAPAARDGGEAKRVATAPA